MKRRCSPALKRVAPRGSRRGGRGNRAIIDDGLAPPAACRRGYPHVGLALRRCAGRRRPAISIRRQASHAGAYLSSLPLRCPFGARPRPLAGRADPGQGGRNADFEVEACDAKGRIALPSQVVDRPFAKKSGDASSPPEEPLVLVGVPADAVITAVDVNAQALGVGIGMAVAKAQALVPASCHGCRSGCRRHRPRQACAVGVAAHLA